MDKSDRWIKIWVDYPFCRWIFVNFPFQTIYWPSNCSVCHRRCDALPAIRCSRHGSGAASGGRGSYQGITCRFLASRMVIEAWKNAELTKLTIKQWWFKHEEWWFNGIFMGMGCTSNLIWYSDIFGCNCREIIDNSTTFSLQVCFSRSCEVYTLESSGQTPALCPQMLFFFP